MRVRLRCQRDEEPDTDRGEEAEENGDGHLSDGCRRVHVERRDHKSQQRSSDAGADQQVRQVLADQGLGGVDGSDTEDVGDAELALAHERERAERHAELLQHQHHRRGRVPIGCVFVAANGKSHLAAKRLNQDRGIDGHELVVVRRDGVKGLAGMVEVLRRDLRCGRTSDVRHGAAEILDAAGQTVADRRAAAADAPGDGGTGLHVSGNLCAQIFQLRRRNLRPRRHHPNPVRRRPSTRQHRRQRTAPSRGVSSPGHCGRSRTGCVH